MHTLQDTVGFLLQHNIPRTIWLTEVSRSNRILRATKSYCQQGSGCSGCVSHVCDTPVTSQDDLHAKQRIYGHDSQIQFSQVSSRD